MAASLLALAAASVFLALNAYSPSPAVVLAAQASGVLFVGAGVFALAAGLGSFVLARPQMALPVLLAVAIAVAVFAAHLYVINSPPTDQCTSTCAGGVNMGGSGVGCEPWRVAAPIGCAAMSEMSATATSGAQNLDLRMEGAPCDEAGRATGA